jgi:ribonucleoside-diphosphate reductase alpha chain
MEIEKTVFTYQQALENSKQYFNGDELAARVFVDKYSLRSLEEEILEDTPGKMHWRIANELGRIESKKFKNPLTKEQIFNYLDKFKKIIPQGSMMFGIGNYYHYATLSNCYVINPPTDSYGGICRTDEQLVQISKRRGGNGTDISHIRPSGLSVKNSSRTTTGIVPFMRRFSNSIREVGQGGRRGALMLTISVHHPQVLDFASIKKDKNEVTGANISIRLTDEFLNAVDKDLEYEQRWPVDSKTPKISIKVKARHVWKEIIKNAHNMAEPGLLFWDTIIKESPADCYKDLGFETCSTNPCSELPLSILDSCRLIVINLLSYVENPFTDKAKFNYESFFNDCKIMQRLIDDAIDLELEHIDRIIEKIKSDPESDDVKNRELELWNTIRKNCFNGRRTGSGITALGDTLAALNIKYGSEESFKKVNKIYKTLKLACYWSSVEMAKELGSFPIWEHNLEKDNPFLLRIKDEDEELWKEMKKYGRRNIAILTTAPTGSESLLSSTTSGIEPLFQIGYTRRKKITHEDKNAKIDFIDNVGDKWQEFVVYHSKIKEWMDISGESDVKKSPWYNCCAEDLNWTDRVKLQSIAQKHIDHAISSTLNLPEHVSVNKVAEIYEEAWKSGCKGITIYRKNCRTGVLVDTEDKNQIKINYNDAPKRPKQIDGKLHFFTVKGEKYYVAVGLINNKEVYEIFTGFNKDKNQEFIPLDAKNGIIIKNKRGDYTFREKITQEEYHLNNGHSDQSAEALTRVISCALRHGSKLEFLIHQLEKTRGDLTSFAKCLARTLKVYLEDGIKITGENCSNCGGTNLQRDSGCSVCKDCGTSKCS